VIIEKVFAELKLGALIDRMQVSKDLETARLSFHMAKLFCKQSRLHEQVLIGKQDIMLAIMQCIRDRDLKAVEKREAL
jgi:hypothetical protein